MLYVSTEMGLLCQYSDILGAPGTGTHAWRVGPFAARDILLTFVLGAVVAFLFGIGFWRATALLFLFSITLHWVFCVDTAVNVFLFGRTKE